MSQPPTDCTRTAHQERLTGTPTDLQVDLAEQVLLTGNIDDDLRTISGFMEQAAQAAVPRTRGRPHTTKKWQLNPEAREWQCRVSEAVRPHKQVLSDETLAELREIQRQARQVISDSQTESWLQWAESL